LGLQRSGGFLSELFANRCFVPGGLSCRPFQSLDKAPCKAFSKAQPIPRRGTNTVCDPKPQNGDADIDAPVCGVNATGRRRMHRAP
jgi:hypothetical protein